MPRISTHAPLAGRDAGRLCFSWQRPISTHAPLAGRDHLKWWPRPQIDISTHAPLAGRDTPQRPDFCELSNFNPRAPCGARQRQNCRANPDWIISTHAPLAGRDFLYIRRRECDSDISTHAPLAGRDSFGEMKISSAEADNFNPRAPCGARQQKCTNHYAHFCDNRQISDAFAQNAACQGILLLFDAGKPCGFWVRTAQVISARLCFAL